MRNVLTASFAVALLLAYTSLVILAIIASLSPGKAGTFSTSMISTMNIIGGITSTLVVSVLAATPPGTVPDAKTLQNKVTEASAKNIRTHTSTKWITGIYLTVWFIAGLAAFIVGQLLIDSKTLPALSDLGQAWCGIALASFYSYFGITPPAPK